MAGQKHRSKTSCWRRNLAGSNVPGRTTLAQQCRTTPSESVSNKALHRPLPHLSGVRNRFLCSSPTRRNYRAGTSRQAPSLPMCATAKHPRGCPLLPSGTIQNIFFRTPVRDSRDSPKSAGWRRKCWPHIPPKQHRFFDTSLFLKPRVGDGGLMWARAKQQATHGEERRGREEGEEEPR